MSASSPLEPVVYVKYCELGKGMETTAMFCRGPIRRREFLRVGVAGLASLSLTDLFRLRELSGRGDSARAGAGADRRVAARRSQPPGNLRP